MTLTKEEAMLDAIDRQREVLEEVAYGTDWGGPAKHHIAYMRGIAVEVLEKGTVTRVP